MLGNDRVEDSTGKLVWVFHAGKSTTADLGGKNIFGLSNTGLGHYRTSCHLDRPPFLGLIFERTFEWASDIAQNAPENSGKWETKEESMINFQTSPEQYKHWRLKVDGLVATLTM